MNNFIKIEWSNDCDLDNIFYQEGFRNSIYIHLYEHEQLFNPPEYKLDRDGAEVRGHLVTNKSTSYKEYKFAFFCCEEMADSLKLIPQHQHVYIQLQDGTTMSVTGDDCQINIIANNEELCKRQLSADKYYHYIFAVELIIRYDVTVGYKCCENFTAMDCDDSDPIINSVTDDGSGDMTTVGVASAYTFVRTKYKHKLARVDLGVADVITDIFTLSQTVAYACSDGGKIYKTTNGGRTWSTDYNGAIALYGIHGTDASNIYAVGAKSGGSGTIKWWDGNSWNTIGGVPNYDLYDVYTTPLGPWSCGEDNIILLGNVTKHASASANDLFGIHALNTGPATDLVMAVGESDTIYYSADSGTSWNARPTGDVANYYGVCNNNGSGLWLIAGAGGRIYKTANSGVAWTAKVSGTANNIRGLHKNMNIGRVYYSTTGGQFQFSDDDGETWADSYLVGDSPSFRKIGVDEQSATEFIIVSAAAGRIYTTEENYTDGNETTADAFLVDGITDNVETGWTYTVRAETFTHMTDPCNESGDTLCDVL